MYSALFKNDYILNEKEPSFFKDLKLDIIAKALFSAKDDQYLIPYLSFWIFMQLHNFIKN